ncbi:MAG: tRNA threonylcarbamoyladenosine dehydratase [Ruminococcus sp.]|nr:tRNA threonylcarbamoyladenosine dehydratase [Ruminococcus sp.]
MYDRLIPLIGEENLKKIKKARVLLVGVGGVGGFTLEALVRSGFQNITIIDGDVIAESNLNRQIIATTNNINEKKVEVAKKRALDINPKIEINTIDVFLTNDNFSFYVKEKYDYIIDACDDIKIKILLIKYAKNHNIRIISCLGTGRKLKPREIEITHLNKTFNDPLAKKLRYELRKENITLDIPVLFSKEIAKDTNNIVASAIFVPSVAGITIAHYIFNDIIN